MQDYGHTVTAMTAGTPIMMQTPLMNDDDADRGWWKSLSAALAFVKWTSAKLDAAERVIAEQQTRIDQLERLATRDELTGVLNRRGFQEHFARELDRANRKQSVGGLVIMIDLDKFKAINDTFGHAAGDAALRLVAQTLQNGSRLTDACARLGGDEFVLLMTNTDSDCALNRARTLVEKLNTLFIEWDGEDIAIGASLGFQAYGAGDTIEKVMNEADMSLYAHKRQGQRQELLAIAG